MTTIMELIKAIWNHIDERHKFFIVVEGGDHFYVEDPDRLEQGLWIDETKEAGVMIFTSLGSASHYREYLIEESDIPPSTLKVVSIELEKVYDLLPKIRAYAKKKYGTPVRLQAIHYHGEFAFTEVLSSECIFRH